MFRSFLLEHVFKSMLKSPIIINFLSQSPVQRKVLPQKGIFSHCVHLAGDKLNKMSYVLCLFAAYIVMHFRLQPTMNPDQTALRETV